MFPPPRPHHFGARIYDGTAHSGLVRSLQPARSHDTTPSLWVVTGRSHSDEQSVRPIARLLEPRRTALTYSAARAHANVCRSSGVCMRSRRA